MADSHLAAMPYRAIVAALALTLGLVACGNGETQSETQSPNGTPTTTSDVPTEDIATDAPAMTEDAQTCPLLDQREISAAIGHDVVFREDYSQATGVEGVCAYTSSDESVHVTVMAVPATFATETFQELRDAATTLTGNDAEPIPMGDGGYAFGHLNGGEAATVAGDLLLDVEIMSTSGPGDEIGNKMDAAVSLLERLLTVTG